MLYTSPYMPSPYLATLPFLLLLPSMESEETKENKPSRVQDLIREIKIIRADNSILHTKVNSLESRMYTKDFKMEELEHKLDKAASRIQFLESEKICLQRKYSARIKNLENEKRKNDIFNQRVMATSNTKKESLMMQEMDSLRAVNKTLLGIIDLLSEQMGFDSSLVKMIAGIADGVEDNILKLFVDSLKAKHAKSIDPKIALCETSTQDGSETKDGADVCYNSI